MQNYLSDIMTQLFGHSFLEDDPTAPPEADGGYSSTGGLSPSALIRLGLLHPGELAKQNSYLQNLGRVPQGSPAGSTDDTGGNVQQAPTQDQLADLINKLFPDGAPEPAPAPAPAPAAAAGGSSGSGASIAAAAAAKAAADAKAKADAAAKAEADRIAAAAAAKANAGNPYGTNAGGKGTSGGGSTYNPYGGSRY
jgi:hypothetical protein